MKKVSLNPYSNGICSKSVKTSLKTYVERES